MDALKSPKECLVCLNSNKTVFVPNEESQKIFNVCCSYVKDAINVEFLISNIIGNQSSLSFCKNCLDCSLNLSQLVEQLSKIKQEISDLSSNFARTITKQRFEATKSTRKRKFNNGNTKFHTANNHKANLDSSERLLAQGLPLPICNREKNPFIQFEASNELINGQIAINEIGSEIVKTESSEIFLDYEDESCTEKVTDDNEGEFETNYLVTENEREIDPFGEIEQEPSSGIVNSFTTVYETNPPMGGDRSLSELDSSVTIPNFTVFIRNDIPATKGDTCTAFYQDKQGVKVPNNLPGGSGSNRNRRTQKTNLRRRSRKIPGREYKHICSICQKSFCTFSKLKRHHVTHTGEKPFKCSICERAFTQSSSLKVHERLHTGEAPYKCSMCESSFLRMKLLKDHEKIHTGEYP